MNNCRVYCISEQISEKFNGASEKTPADSACPPISIYKGECPTHTMQCISLYNYARGTAVVHLILFITLIIFDSTMTTPHQLVTISTKSVAIWLPQTVNLTTDPYITSHIKNTCPLADRAMTHSSQFYSTPIVFKADVIDTRYIIFCFHLISFLFQITATLDKNTYEAPMKEGKTTLSHFFEYSISASIMMLAISVQLENRDLFLNLLIFSNTWACMIFGAIAEVLYDLNLPIWFELPEITIWTNWIVIPRIKSWSIGWHWFAHFCGWITLAFAWAATISSVATYRECITFESSVPTWLIYVVAAEVVVFWCFAFVQIYVFIRKRRTNPQDEKSYKEDTAFNQEVAYTAEYTYVTLSLIAKTLLSVAIFGGSYKI